MIFRRHVHDPGQHRGAYAARSAVVGFAYRFKQVADAAAVQGGDEVHPGKVDKAQTIVEGLLHLLLHFLTQAIPLVNDDHQRTAAVKNKAQQREVLVGDPFASIDHQQHDVGVFNRLQRFDHRELFHDVGDFPALAHPGGIDEHVFALVTLHRDINAVTGGARHIVDHHAIFTEDAIGEG